MTHGIFSKLTLALCILCISACFVFVPSPGWADINAQPKGTCTSDPDYEPVSISGGNGIISTIISDINDILEPVTQSMFNSIVDDTGFIQTARVAVTLYIAIYGILFMFGMVQITLYDFAIRMIKIGIIGLLLSGSAWSFFNNNVVHFFNDGTNEIICKVQEMTVGPITGATSCDDGMHAPFQLMDDAVNKAFSAKMAITLMSVFTNGPYGAIFGILLLTSLGSFVKSIFTALWVYIMSLVLRALLFALAPVFLCCLLFNKTRHLFDGWLNQIVNACLQPIFLFMFFAFFVQLIAASLDNILSTPVCWTEWADSLRGSPLSVHFWRHAIRNTTTGQWEPFSGVWSWSGAQDASGNAANGPIFPIDLMTILIFLMLAELAGKFNTIVLLIANDIAGASTNLSDMGGSMAEWFTSGDKKGGIFGGGEDKAPLPASGAAAGVRGGPGVGGSSPAAGSGAAPPPAGGIKADAAVQTGSRPLVG